ncbi:putative 50S ribosomal protein L10 [Ochrobactrum quorumnocens]|uniref:Putative 50S ribosomal protein L10 n=1 Tax=Ochrobactrum quorumnocens TaxID=271865 RepID=A0A248UIM1_9HYPH|nr:putative 50S ribosomal protein L10 [[Ochrobactrum] quorumnocens]
MNSAFAGEAEGDRILERQMGRKVYLAKATRQDQLVLSTGETQWIERKSANLSRG